MNSVLGILMLTITDLFRAASKTCLLIDGTENYGGPEAGGREGAGKKEEN